MPSASAMRSMRMSRRYSMLLPGLNRMMTMTSEESQFRSRLGLLVSYLETAVEGAAYHVPPEQEKSDE
jgi:hypothetical protein